MTRQQVKLDFANAYILEDDFAKLIPLKEGHTQPLSQISNDADIWKYFFEEGDTIQKLTKYVMSAIENRKASNEYPFVVFDKKNGQYAGTTRFYDYSGELNTIKLGHTWYGKAFRGTDLNKHCKYLLFEFAFEKLGVERIGFGAYMDNTRSIAAMKSVGCKKEGVLRNMFPSIDGRGRTDAILMSILKKEWHERVKSDIIKKIKP
ncbi:MAG: GNAT family N-acetyltransferase [Pricia sp.]|nr:GNAT family N-acetyltransferase [Pricia sp.]